MKNIIQSITVNSDHSITVNDTYFQTLTKAQILSIYDRTTGTIIVADTDVETKVTITNGNTITTDASLPMFIDGHTILITVDAGLIGAMALVSEVTAGKSTLAYALNLRGQNSTSNDSYDQMASKIMSITGNVTVVSTDVPSTWHDMAYEISQWNDITVPFRIGLLLVGEIKNVDLQYGIKFKTSDGIIYSSSQTNIAIGANERVGKTTKYIIFGFANPNTVCDLSSSYRSLIRSVLLVYNFGCDLSNIKLSGLYAGKFINDASLTNPVIYNGVRYPITFSSNQFQYLGDTFIFPQFANDATDAERNITLVAGLFYYSAIKQFYLPVGAKTLTINIGNNTLFQYCTYLLSVIFNCETINIITSGAYLNQGGNLKYVRFEASKSLNITGSYFFYGTLAQHVYIANPSDSCSIGSTFFYVGAANIVLLSIELQAGWNWTVPLTNADISSGENAYKYICQRLIDYRADGVNTPTLTANGTTAIVGTNTQFTKVHHVGETIVIGGTSKIIASIQDDTHLTLTTTLTSGNGLSYGMNKTLTLSSTTKTNLSTYNSNWQTELTSKGWTVA